MNENKYSKITLLLNDKEERRKFKVFRNEDVFSMFSFVCILASCEVVFQSVTVLYTLYTRVDVSFNLIKLVCQLVITGSSLLVWLLGKRFKDQYDLMIAAVVGTNQFAFALSIELLSAYKEPGMVDSVKLVGYLLFGVLLLAPSFHFVLFYIGTFSITFSFVVMRYTKEKQELFGFGLLMIMAFVTFWYLFHKRELKRFYQQQDAERKEIKAMNKEIEVTNVLNLQQNAVIIFSEDDTLHPDENEDCPLRKPTL